MPVKVSFVLCESWPSMNQVLWLGEYNGFNGQKWVTSISTTRIWDEVNSTGNPTDQDEVKGVVIQKSIKVKRSLSSCRIAKIMYLSGTSMRMMVHIYKTGNFKLFKTVTPGISTCT